MDKLFRPENIDGFLHAIFANATPVDAAPAGTWQLRSISQKATLQNVDLFRAVIECCLKEIWRLKGAGGLAALHLDLAEVLDVFEGPPLIGLTRSDLGRQLHVNSSTVSPLLRNGMIASKEVPDPRTRQPLSLVAVAELDQFLNRHLPLGFMAYQLGTQAKHVAARLDRAEVWPILLPEHCSKIYPHPQESH